jgi:hypothetical protein
MAKRTKLEKIFDKIEKERPMYGWSKNSFIKDVEIAMEKGFKEIRDQIAKELYGK